MERVRGGSLRTWPGLAVCSVVALGDSWVSGPLIADIVGDPLDCGRSSRNFPSLVARELGVARFIDASCGGAKIRDSLGPRRRRSGAGSVHSSVALPLHPNEYSHRSTASVVLEQLGALGID